MPSDPPIHTLTFEELKAKAQEGETLVSRQGYPISTKDRKWDERKALELWTYDRQTYGGDMPEDTRPKNKKGRRFSWSYSALTNFEGCPKRYYHEKFLCDAPFVESEAMAWGNRVHTAGELHVLGQDHKDPDAFKEVEKYAKLFRAKKESGVEVQPELEIVLNQYMKPLVTSDAWFSDKAWFRCKIDVPVIQGAKASIFDYKTGKKVKDEKDQLEINLAALSIVRPELEEFTGKLIWTKHQKVTEGVSLDREGVRQVWEKTLARVERLRQAWETENFPARSSGLCPWCAIYDRCEYARKR